MDILLAISHPDDDAIFAGALQQQLAAHAWSVVCLTGDPREPRGVELLSWQGALGTPVERMHFLGEPDDPNDYRSGRSSIAAGTVTRGLRALALSPALVVSHNALGEYGHPHHRLLHAAVADVFSETPRLEFGYGRSGADLEIPCMEKWPSVARCYPSQQRVIEKLQTASEKFFWSQATPAEVRWVITRSIGLR